jgi:hypothetical protein
VSNYGETTHGGFATGILVTVAQTTSRVETEASRPLFSASSLHGKGVGEGQRVAKGNGYMGGPKETMEMQNGKSCDQEVPISIAIHERTLSQSTIQSGQSIQYGRAPADNRVTPVPTGQPTVNDRL